MDSDLTVHDKLDAGLCPECLDTFYTPQELMKHFFNQHYCSQCVKSCEHGVTKTDYFPNLPQPVSARKVSEELSDSTSQEFLTFKCDLCCKSFQTENEYESHSEKKECHICCGEHFETDTVIWTHLMKNHRVKSGFDCGICKLRFDTEEAAGMHRKFGHKIGRRWCHHCSRDLDSEHQLVTHMEKVHNVKIVKKNESKIHIHPLSVFLRIVSEEFPDPYVTQEVSVKLDPANVTPLSSDQKGGGCGNCMECFDTDDALQRHWIEVHKGKKAKSRYQELLNKKAKETKILKCEFCEDKFTSQIILKSHVQIVHGSKSKKRKADNMDCDIQRVQSQ